MSYNKIPVLLLAILVISLMLKLTCFLIVYSYHPSCIISNDTSGYDNSAKALVRTGRFAIHPEQPDIPQTLRTPGYPSFIALIYLIAGQKHLHVIIVQLLISTATIAIIYLISGTLWGYQVALLTALLLSIDMVSFCYSQMLLTETLFSFFVVLAALGGVYLILDKGSFVNNSLLLGTALAFATLVRPISYYLVIPILIGIFIAGKAILGRWKKIIISIFLIILPSIIFIGGWQLRNHIVAGSSEFSGIKGINLLYYRGADIVAERDGISLEEARRKLSATMTNNPWINERYSEEGLALIYRYPFLYGKIMIKGIIFMMIDPGNTPLMKYVGLMKPDEKTGPLVDFRRLSLNRYLQKWLIERPLEFSAFAFGILYLATLYSSIAYCMRKLMITDEKKTIVHIFIWGVILYFLIVSGGPEAYSRFRTPIMPFFCLYGGTGLFYLYKDIFEK